MIFEGRVLALDLATTTGFAFGAPGSIPQCGHIRFASLGSSRAKVYRHFRSWLEQRWNVRNHQPDLIVFESPMQGMMLAGRTNIESLKMLGGLAEHLEEWCYEKVELREASVSQVRSHFIGKNMKSELAKRYTFQRCKQLGWPVETTDESDACALWDYQCCWLNPRLAVHTTPLFQPKK